MEELKAALRARLAQEGYGIDDVALTLITEVVLKHHHWQGVENEWGPGTSSEEPTNPASPRTRTAKGTIPLREPATVVVVSGQIEESYPEIAISATATREEVAICRVPSRPGGMPGTRLAPNALIAHMRALSAIPLDESGAASPEAIKRASLR